MLKEKYTNAIGQEFTKHQLRPNFYIKLVTSSALVQKQLSRAYRQDRRAQMSLYADNAWSEDGGVTFALFFLIEQNQ